MRVVSEVVETTAALDVDGTIVGDVVVGDVVTALVGAGDVVAVLVVVDDDEDSAVVVTWEHGLHTHLIPALEQSC